MPSSVLDLVNARVADLTEEERDLLDVASCCGFEFDPAARGRRPRAGPDPRAQALRPDRAAAPPRAVRRARLRLRPPPGAGGALRQPDTDSLREEYHAAIAEALEARAGCSGQGPEGPRRRPLRGPLRALPQGGAGREGASLSRRGARITWRRATSTTRRSAGRSGAGACRVCSRGTGSVQAPAQEDESSGSPGPARRRRTRC